MRVCLIIEDKEIDDALQEVLEEFEISYVVKKDYLSAKKEIEKGKYDFFITDNYLPLTNNDNDPIPTGIKLIKYLRARGQYSLVPAMLLSGDNSYDPNINENSILISIFGSYLFKDLSYKRRKKKFEEFFNSPTIEKIKEEVIKEINKELDNDTNIINLILHEIFFTTLNYNQTDINNNKEYLIKQFIKLNSLIHLIECRNIIIKNKIENSIKKLINEEYLDKNVILRIIKLFRYLLYII